MLDLVAKLYEAALEPAAWPEVIAQLGAAFGGAAAFVVADPGNEIANISEYENLHPEYVRSYQEHYGRSSPWVREFNRLPAGSLIHHTLVPDLDLKRTAYYNDWLLPQDLEDVLGGILDKAGGSLSYACVIRSRRLGGFQRDDHERFRVFLRHARQALKVHARLAQAGSERSGLLAALDRAGLGAFLLTEDRRLVAHNDIAGGLLSDGSAFRREHGFLCVRRPESDGAMRRAVMSACAARQGELVHVAGMRSEAAPLVVFVMPLGEGHAQLAMALPASRCALVLVKDPARFPASSSEVLRALFGLTGAEARLLSAIGAGDSLEDIGRERGVRHGTVRAQLRSVMAKTGASRQAELVALVARHAALDVAV